MGMSYYDLGRIFKANTGKVYRFAQKHMPMTAGRVASKMGEAEMNQKLATKLQQKAKAAGWRGKYDERRIKHHRRIGMR